MNSRRPAPIAFFLPSMRFGGVQRVILNLVQGMDARGLPVDVVLADARGEYLGQLPSGVRVVDLKAGRLARSIQPLAGYLRREQPRVLVPSMTHANLVALWAARLARRATPVVVTIHNTMTQASTERGRWASLVEPRLLRIFYPWARTIVAVSGGAADDFARLLRLPRERVKVVYNPVITPELMALSRQAPDHPWLEPGQRPVILGVGRFTGQKDFPTLIRAFAEVRRQEPARLIILGEGEGRSSLEALVRQLGLEADVALPGFRNNAMAYMAKSALFVLSSAWEGLPTVLIEAMAAGTRVISTDCPSGPREILQDGRLGALVPVGDPGALAAAAIAALRAPANRVPPEALEPFTLDAAVDNYLSLIEDGR
jgi:glycosyltransferase involved in cell wall biosynthesis